MLFSFKIHIFPLVNFFQVDPLPEPWGNESIGQILSEMDPDVDCVLVAFDVNVSYVKIVRAANYLEREGSLFCATDGDAVFPVSGGRTLPGTGPILSAVATTAGREATVLGKPSEAVFRAVTKRFPDVRPERTVVIGDR